MLVCEGRAYGIELVALILGGEILDQHIVYGLCEESLEGEVPTLILLLQGQVCTRHLRISKILCHNIKKIVGSYVAEMNGVDALVFTAGIGENDRDLREEVCKNMSFLGIEIDECYNQSCPRGETADISATGAKVKTFVIPTNEEYMIALDTQNLTK